MFFVLFVLHDVGACDDVLTAWDEAGVSGITILPSTGLARMRQKWGLRDDIPLFPTLADISSHEERLNRTFFTIVNDEATVDKIVAATENVVGNLDEPDTGILVVMPIMKAYGLNRKEI